MSITLLRNDLKQARRNLTDEERASKSFAITQFLLKYLPIRRAQKIAAYVATPDEVATQPLMEALAQMEKSLFLPVINRSSWRDSPMLFHAYTPFETPLKDNRYGIPEPVHRIGQCVRGIDMDVALFPLVGFNDNLDRIGMGAGYYDRAFAKPGIRNTTLIGLAFDCQRAPFTAKPHDVPLHAIVTESGIIESQVAR